MGPRLRRQRARPVPGDARRRAAAEARARSPASSTPRASSACVPARSRCPTPRARRRSSTSPRRSPGTSGPRSASTRSRPGWMEGDWMERMLERQVRRPDGQAREGDAAAALRHRRRRRRDDDEPDRVATASSPARSSSSTAASRARPDAMLPGVVPFPPEFAAALPREGLLAGPVACRRVCGRSSPDTSSRIALIDGDRRYTYERHRPAQRQPRAEPARARAEAARPRRCCTLPNVAEFVSSTSRCRRSARSRSRACHAPLSRDQPVRADRAAPRRGSIPERHRDFEFEPIVAASDRRTRASSTHRARRDGRRARSRADRRKPARPRRRLARSRSIPPTRALPALRRHDRRAEADPAHAQRLRLQLEDGGAGLRRERRLGAAPRAADRAQPAARLSGHPGLHLQGRRRSCSRPTRGPRTCSALVEKHRVTHIKVVPALLIRLINDPSIARYDLSSLRVIQSGGQRMQPEVRLKTQELIPSAFVQENFGMSEGVLMFVRLDDPDEVKLETCGRPICPDDEVQPVRRRRPRGAAGRGRRTDLPRPLHAARLLRRARVQRAAVHARRLLPFGRPDAPAPVRQLRGRGPQEGPHQPRRREDQRRGDREPHPAAPGGAERGLRADARPRPGRAHVRLRHPARRACAVARGAGRLPRCRRRSRSSSCRSG